MRQGDPLHVVNTIPSSSAWHERVQLHPSTLKAFGLQTASPAIIILQDDVAVDQRTVRLANVWPRSTLNDGDVFIPFTLTSHAYKTARLFPLRASADLPKATLIECELLPSAAKAAELDRELKLLLECLAREHLNSLGYAVVGQELDVALQSSEHRVRIKAVKQSEPLTATLLPSTLPKDVAMLVMRAAVVSRSCRIIMQASTSSNGAHDPDEAIRHQIIKLQEESAYATLGGLDRQIAELKRLVEMPLRRPEVFQRYGLKPPRGLLLFGPPGTGKTTLAYSAAKSCVAATSIEVISGPELTSSLHGGTERALRKVFSRARRNSPSVVIIDEIDALAPRRDGNDPSSDGTGEVEKRVVATLLTLMDGLSNVDEKSRVVVIAATNRPNAIDPALRRPGRLDREIEVGIPTSDARLSILSVLLRGVPHLLSEHEIRDVAGRTHGYVGADLSALVREAGMRALSREVNPSGLSEQLNSLSLTSTGQGVIYEDFISAQALIRPSAMREIALEVPKVSWKDIAPGQAGLQIQQKVRECVEWPLKHKDTMKRLGISAPKGVLLYGPPGCSKTLIARALASESGLNFVAVKGPELLNKYVGESERALRDVFRKARAAAPSIVFFDEIDGLTTSRGAESASSDKIIATLLNEMDGVEQAAGVLVVAATNRPEVIDTALLRPGRLDRLLYVAPPDLQARRQILTLRSQAMALAPNIDLDKVATMTEGCSGAEIVSICQEAGLMAMNEDLQAASIRQEHLEAAAASVQRRITPAMLRRYEEWRDQAATTK